jgi:filamentous hemagglutinin family protein
MATLAVLWLGSSSAHANPRGGMVTQGAASFSVSGAQLTISTSDHAFINWQSFNIGVGETTTFVQPSSSSLVWNRINDPNPSQILGTLNANGYVVLQNPSGFYIGGQAAISTHGLVMTTAPVQFPSLLSGGAWEFDAPPPTARIVNYGRINVAGGAPLFLIASDIENNGTLSDPGGKIGLYAGEKVLVSTSPDGRGLSAEVTLPKGSVDNNGKLMADGGSIALRAEVVNQRGLIQANSVREVNGTVELVASDSLSLGAGSAISARGDSQGASPGGAVMLKSGNSFSDQTGPKVDVSGGAQGGNGGQVEISAPQLNPIRSALDGHAGSGFAGAVLTLDPYDLSLDQSYVSSLDGQISEGGLSQVRLQADHNIDLSTVWTLGDAGSSATLSLSAGNDITLENGSGISAGRNWNLELSAGTSLGSGATPNSGEDGIYLTGNAYLQTQNGDIHLNAANEVQVGWTGQSGSRGAANPGTGRIITTGGGNIQVSATHGDVNSGSDTSGFNYLKNAPFYTPFSVNPFTGAVGKDTTLGGISTAAGGDVSINAGGDVVSYLPVGSPNNPGSSPPGDPGTGAFGSEPGNVSVEAKGSVYGHYVAVNGQGTITAGKDAGGPDSNLALSLVKGRWSVAAPNGDIYLQEVRNPNGVFNAQGSLNSAGYHLFDYDALASVSLIGGNAVYLSGQNLPRPADDVPILLPPALTISSGAGGILLDASMTLFPSAYANLDITTEGGGDFAGANNASLVMSDSAHKRWIPPESAPSGPKPFSPTDHGAAPAELNNSDPAVINISGNMENVILQTSKRTQITVGGDMLDSSFSGENLHADDVTSISVAGRIYNEGSFNWVYLSQPIQNVPLANLPPDSVVNWQTALGLAVDPAKVASLTISANIDPSQYAAYVNQVLLFGNSLQSSFAYNPASRKLTFVGSMSPTVKAVLDQPLTLLRYDANGRPVVDSSGHFVTDRVAWVSRIAIDQLYQASQGAPSLADSGGGYVLGGGGELDVQAGSISLGNAYGIISLGSGALLGRDYSYLTPYISGGASIKVTSEGDLNMPSSTIAALGGGNVGITSVNGAMDLGSQELVDFEGQIMKADNLGLGIYTSGGGDVDVRALGDINVDSSRIGTFNGGTVRVESLQGNVNAGSGGRVSIPINVFSPRYRNPNTPFEYVYANGIVAETLVSAGQMPGSAQVPGDITIETPRGDILASQGGILQEALNGNISSGPTVTLAAGTAPSEGSAGYPGNIDLGNSGVIGGTVNLKANGNITGLVVSRQNSTVQAAQSFTGTVLSGGSANLSAGGTVSGAVIGIGGVNASGAGGVSATLLGQNVSVNGGAAQSTLGTTAAPTASSQAAAQQSSSDTAQQVAGNAPGGSDEKKKKKAQPLLRRVKRVTVILPKSG